MKLRFLADSGADVTVFSADLWKLLRLRAIPTTLRVEGVGGRAPSEEIETQIEFTTATGSTASFRGRFLAITDPAALDMSVLGRDITNHFALIVDRPQDVVCLIGHGHRYSIMEG